MHLRALLSASTLLLATPVLAQAPAQPPGLNELVRQPASQAAILAAAKAQYAQIPGRCAAAKFDLTSELTVFQAPRFGTGPNPIAGMWAEKVNVAGCGPTKTLNVLTVAQPEGDPQRIALMPGTSHADPVTQRSALQYAQAIAGRASPANCRQQSFLDAQFDGYVGLPSPDVRDGRDGRAWREDWLLFACGAVYDIKLQFTPNAQGTQLSGTNPIKVGGEVTPDPAPAPPAPHAAPPRPAARR